jgi:hypothetical protein
MRFIQYLDGDGNQRVGCTSTDAGRVRRLDGVASTVALAQAAFAHALPMEQMAELRLGALEPTPLARMLESLRVLTPLMHDDPSRCLVTGTGLTHLGSAATRDAMHHKVNAQEESALTDSMRMFKWGLEGGRPAAGAAGVQPEWFYKGDGSIVVAPGAALPSPNFALDGGEEPELVGLYWIAPDGTPCRLGFAVGNEFSDHVTERQNYLYLAHSKLRACAVGPELRSGALPADLQRSSPARTSSAPAGPRGRQDPARGHRRSGPRRPDLQVLRRRGAAPRREARLGAARRRRRGHARAAGVIGLITPWNFPIAIPAWKIAPALAYGNTVVFKPADLVPGSAWALADIISRAGLPAGVFNLVMGRGSVVGQAMLDARSSTRSASPARSAPGKRVAAACAPRAPSSSWRWAARTRSWCWTTPTSNDGRRTPVNSAFFSTGQRCTASSALIVTEGIHDRFVDAMRRA